MTRRPVQIAPLRDAIAALVDDGDTVALEGFTHLIPTAAGQEIIRQGRRDLTLVRLTPDIVYDQMIGMGCARKLVFSWGGNPGVGSLHRFRDAVRTAGRTRSRSRSTATPEWQTATRQAPPGCPLPCFAATWAAIWSPYTASIKEVTCPFTGEVLSAVSALELDVAVIHAQRADREGNVQLWGIIGVQKEAILCARRVLVTVEEVVEVLEPRPGAILLPHWTIDYVSEVPNGAYPSYAHDYTERDNDFYVSWDAISRDRDVFRRWMEDHVLAS